MLSGRVVGMTAVAARRIVPRGERHALLQTLVQTACRTANWGAAARPKERLAAALMAHSFSLDAHGVVLDAWVTPELQLAVQVIHVASWTVDVDWAIQELLADSPSLVAGLLLHDWSVVSVACAARRRSFG
jgi:hypothetical protein